MTRTTGRPARNGVDVPTLFATLNTVKGAPALADFQSRAHNTWQSGSGRPAQRWRSRSWESLRRLTPNWLSRLPDWTYIGPDVGATDRHGAAA